ncbi:MAG TPA: T9SS type A sorting domain-containing protein, partial [Chitinophagales bacterium]|nr:T9SS type A sorting domain-containing protein [Chitinophagales bacterium]
DSIATWAIDVSYPYVSLALINNEIFGIPFYSNVGGIALLEWNAVPVVGIEATPITALQMYPNPVANTMHIMLSSGMKNYLIKDMSGRNILEGTTNNNNIDCTSLNAGMYTINLFDTQGTILSSGVFIKL